MADTEPAAAGVASTRISASAYSRWQSCPRLWGYTRDTERAPDRPAQALGRQVHTWLEAYLASTDPPPDVVSRAATLALRVILPLAALGIRRGDPDLLLEKHFEFGDPDDPTITWHGYPDVVWPFDAGGESLIIDYKTTYNVAAFAMDEADLLDDTQRILYASSTGTDTRCVWIYLDTSDGSTRAVEVREKAADTRERLRRLLPIAQQIQANADTPPRDLPRNDSHCTAYGGCRFFVRCWLEDWS